MASLPLVLMCAQERVDRFVDSCGDRDAGDLHPKVKKMWKKNPTRSKFFVILNSEIVLDGKIVLVKNLLNGFEKNRLLHILSFSDKKHLYIKIPTYAGVMSNLVLVLNHIFGGFIHYNVYSPQYLKLRHTGVQNMVTYGPFVFYCFNEKLVFTKLGTLYIYLGRYLVIGRYSVIDVLREILLYL